MAMNLNDPTAQTLVWPGSSQYTNSIFLSGMYELIGMFIDTLAANTAILRLQVSEDAPSIADASATFVDARDVDYEKVDITSAGTAMADGDTFVKMAIDSYITGPMRIRLLALQSDGSTAVNGTADDSVRPVFRTV